MSKIIAAIQQEENNNNYLFLDVTSYGKNISDDKKSGMC
jgi:hypothetical protein